MRGGITRTEIAVIVGIILLIGFISWPVIEFSIRNGPVGRAIPREPPDESRRVHHPSGVSIIAPENWEHLDATSAESSLVIYARSIGRTSGMIVIKELTEPPDLAALTKTVFQNGPAYEHMEITREWTLDDKASSSYELYFRRSGNWYCTGYTIDQERTTLPDAIREYLETIRIQESNAADPAND